MKFDSYFLLPSVQPNRQSLQNMLQNIDAVMIEASDSSNPYTLIIGSVQEVLENFESEQYYASDVLIHDMIKKRMSEFPFSTSDSADNSYGSDNDNEDDESDEDDGNDKNDCRQLVSLCLSNQTLTYVSSDFDLLIDLIKKASLLGAISVKKFKSSVTAVVSSTTASEIVYEAWENSVPVVSFDWIRKCFSSLKMCNLAQYRLQVFSGCVFTTSDISSAQTKSISEKIESNGGKFDKILNNSETNFLISTNLSKSKKNMIALNFSIPIVRPEFIDESIKKGGVNPKHFTMNWYCMEKEIEDNKSTLFINFTFHISPTIENQEALEECIEAHSGNVILLESASAEESSTQPDFFIAEHGFDINKLHSNNSNEQILANKSSQQSSLNNSSEQSSTENEPEQCSANNATDRIIFGEIYDNLANFDNYKKTSFVTDYWIFRCVENKHLLDINDCVLYRPLKKPNVSDDSKICVSLYHLPERTRTLFADIVRYIGWQPAFNLLKNATYIVADVFDNGVHEYSTAHNIPIVKSLFLIETAKKGVVCDPAKYALQIPQKNIQPLDQICLQIMDLSKTNVPKGNGELPAPALKKEELEKFSQVFDPSQISQEKPVITYDTGIPSQFK